MSRLKILFMGVAGLVCLGLIGGWAVTLEGDSSARVADGHHSLPNVSLLTLENEALTLEPGFDSPLLINVWATWCRPCLEELPSLNRLYAELDDTGVRMIALNYGDNLMDVRRFLTETEIDFDVLLDVTTAFGRELPMKGLPTTFLVDTEGLIQHQFEGAADWASEERVEEIRRLIKTLE